MFKFTSSLKGHSLLNGDNILQLQCLIYDVNLPLIVVFRFLLYTFSRIVKCNLLFIFPAYLLCYKKDIPKM